MELVIKSITPAVVQMNIEEVEKYMAEVKEKYQNIVFTADEVKMATEERTKLNKLEKNILEVRKKIEKDGMADIKSIIDTLKTAEKDTKALSNNIGEQIKKFEEEEWQKKLEEIGEFKNKIFGENKLLERYFVIGDKWKNKTMTIKKIEEEIKEQFEYWNKRYNFITSQLIAVNEEIENKLKFEDVQYLVLEEYDNIMKKLVDKKNEIKTTEENMRIKAEEDKQKALAELEAKKEQEKQEAIQQTQKTYVASDPKIEKNEKYFDTTIRFPRASLSFLKELKRVSEIYGIKSELKENIELGDE
ncbi:DUF1351 domain-containing protein [Pseudoleptotrichia goodfellowii]|uniref:DUF1351 domain-containing protein n=1 Tax=Pseudoleptotrichia goodfellowii TaxID=157692 RepID=A0A510J807_9FUSO|nr:DUF1351 domain-containing protein [Pseudoleptotrichia goodfellowii]BBM35399.1 hypothetical protein JCM16774_0311 [Pseudoleptotrichia goodfellowii]